MAETLASITFPGYNNYVSIVKDVDPTSNFSTYYVSADQSIDALSNYCTEIAKGITVVSLKNEIVGAYEALILNGSHETYIPITVLLGRILINLQHISHDQFATVEVTNFVMNSLQQYVTASFQSDGFPTMLSRLKTIQVQQPQQTKTSPRTSSSTCNSNKNSPRDDDAHSVVYFQSYRVMRNYIPTDIFSLSLQSIIQQGLSRPIAERVWKTKILWLICMHPLDIAKVHIGDLRGKYISHGLDLLEMRAVWHVLPDWPGKSDKAQWRRNFKEKLDSLALAEFNGTISTQDRRHAVYQGYDNNDLNVYDPDQPLTQRFLEGVGEYNTNTRTNHGGNSNTLYNDFLMLSPALSVSIPPYSNSNTTTGVSGNDVAGISSGTSSLGEKSGICSRTNSNISGGSSLILHSPTDCSSKSFAAFLLRLDQNDNDENDDDGSNVPFEELKEENIQQISTDSGVAVQVPTRQPYSISSIETAVVDVAEPSSPVRNLHTQDYNNNNEMYSPSPSYRQQNRDSLGSATTPSTHSHYNTLQIKLRRLRESMQGSSSSSSTSPRRPTLKMIPPPSSSSSSAAVPVSAQLHQQQQQQRKSSLSSYTHNINIDDNEVMTANSSQLDQTASLESCLIGYSGTDDGNNNAEENINDITINRQKNSHRYNHILSDFVDSTANTPVAYKVRPSSSYHRYSYDYVDDTTSSNNNLNDLMLEASNSDNYDSIQEVNGNEKDNVENNNNNGGDSDDDSHTWKSVASATRDSRGGSKVVSVATTTKEKKENILTDFMTTIDNNNNNNNNTSSSSPPLMPADTSIEIKNDAMQELLLYNYYFNEKLEQQQSQESVSNSPRGQGNNSNNNSSSSSSKKSTGRARSNKTIGGGGSIDCTNHHMNNNNNNQLDNNNITSPFATITDNNTINIITTADASQYPPPLPIYEPISPIRRAISSSNNNNNKLKPSSSPPATPIQSNNSHSNNVGKSAVNNNNNNTLMPSPISPISPDHHQYNKNGNNNICNDNSSIMSSPTLSQSLPPSVDPSPTHHSQNQVNGKNNPTSNSSTTPELKRNDSRSLFNNSNHSSSQQQHTNNSSPNHPTASNNNNTNNNTTQSQVAYRVVIQSADNLSTTARKHSPYPSAYCTLYLVNKHGKSLVNYNAIDCQTRVEKNTITPVWNKEFVLRLTSSYTGPQPAGVMLEVKDSSSGIFGHKHLGQTVVPIDCFLANTEAQFCLPLESVFNSKALNSALDSLGEIRVLTELIVINSSNSSLRMFSLQTPRSSTGTGGIGNQQRHTLSSSSSGSSSVLSKSSHSGDAGGDVSSVIDNSRMSSGNKYDGNRSYYYNNNYNNNHLNSSSIFDVDMNDSMLRGPATDNNNRSLYKSTNNNNGYNNNGIAASSSPSETTAYNQNSNQRCTSVPLSPFSSSHSLSLLITCNNSNTHTPTIKRTQSEEDLFIENEVNNFIIPYDLSPTGRQRGRGRGVNDSGSGFEDDGDDDSRNGSNNNNEEVFLVKDIIHTNILTSSKDIDGNNNRRRIFSTDEGYNSNNNNGHDENNDSNSNNDGSNERHTYATTVTTQEDRTSTTSRSSGDDGVNTKLLNITEVFNRYLPIPNEDDDEDNDEDIGTIDKNSKKYNRIAVQKIKKMYEADEVSFTTQEASVLLLQYCEYLASHVDTFVAEPLELLMLLIDCFGADVNYTSTTTPTAQSNKTESSPSHNYRSSVSSNNGMTALHHLFNQPLLGRYLVFRGANIFTPNEYNESVLELCMEYDCDDWLIPVFESTGAEQHILLLQRQHRHEEEMVMVIDSDDSEEDRDDNNGDPINNRRIRNNNTTTTHNQCNNYIKTLLFKGNYLNKIKDMLKQRDVYITASQANQWLAEMTENGVFQNMTINAVETFEFLDYLATNNVTAAIIAQDDADADADVA